MTPDTTALLTLLPRMAGTDLIFPSTFRDWVAERTEYPGDLAEIALAHKVGNAVEQAYRRGDMVAKRRQMMMDWGAFLSA